MALQVVHKGKKGRPIVPLALSSSGRQPDAQGQARVLVVDDDPWICRLLSRLLNAEGMAVETVTSGCSMWQKLRTWPCDLVVLDLRLPAGEDGLSLARAIRKESNIGLIMLTGRTDAVDKVVGLEIGADDYVTKPFDARELLARIRSVLRRVDRRRVEVSIESRQGQVLHFAEWTLDIDHRTLTDAAGEYAELTTYEFELLAVLATHPGRPLSREQILDLIAHRHWDPDNRSVDVLVGKLRRKLGDDARAPKLIKTVRGLGYVFTGEIE
ncbi:MAG: response regulator transcription factor [Pseudomonadota bacterium]